MSEKCIYCLRVITASGQKCGVPTGTPKNTCVRPERSGRCVYCGRTITGRNKCGFSPNGYHSPARL